MTAADQEPGRPRTARAVLGLLALCLLIGAVAVTGRFLGGGFEGGVPVSAVFSSRGVGQQLPVGGDVKVRGVLVGRIEDIELADDGTAVVEIRLNGDVELPADSTAEIRSKTIFGQKWVELIPPDTGTGALLTAGSVIANDRTREPLELERELQLGHDLLSRIPLRDLSTVLRSLADGFTGQEKDARVAIDQGLVALRALNSRSNELDAGLSQLREFSEWLDDNDENLLSFMRSLDDANRALVGAAPEFRASLQSFPRFLDDFAAFQESTEVDLGRLVEEGATVAEVVAARSDDLEALVRNLEAFTTVWNSGLSQPCSGAFESNLTCWQIYQPPGLDSRGLYGRGASPLSDESGDPLPAIAAASTDFARILHAPLSASTAQDGAP